MIIHFTSFAYDINDDTKLDSLINNTVTLVTTCGTISYYRMESFVFFPTALALIFIFSWSIKRRKRCLHLCNGRPGKEFLNILYGFDFFLFHRYNLTD
jgi:hypothetical protein